MCDTAMTLGVYGLSDFLPPPPSPPSVRRLRHAWNRPNHQQCLGNCINHKEWRACNWSCILRHVSGEMNSRPSGSICCGATCSSWRVLQTPQSTVMLRGGRIPTLLGFFLRVPDSCNLRYRSCCSLGYI
jgi:hypothetical protein